MGPWPGWATSFRGPSGSQTSARPQRSQPCCPAQWGRRGQTEEVIQARALPEAGRCLPNPPRKPLSDLSALPHAPGPGALPCRGPGSLTRRRRAEGGGGASSAAGSRAMGRPFLPERGPAGTGSAARGRGPGAEAGAPRAARGGAERAEVRHRPAGGGHGAGAVRPGRCGEAGRGEPRSAEPGSGARPASGPAGQPGARCGARGSRRRAASFLAGVSPQHPRGGGLRPPSGARATTPLPRRRRGVQPARNPAGPIRRPGPGAHLWGDATVLSASRPCSHRGAKPCGRSVHVGHARCRCPMAPRGCWPLGAWVWSCVEQ